MEKEISFSEGLKLTPYSDVCPDGELAQLENLEVYNGSLRPRDVSGQESTVGDVTIDCVHSTGGYNHFIYHDAAGNYYWCERDKTDGKLNDVGTTQQMTAGNKVASKADLGSTVQVQSMSTMGNVVVFCCSDEVKYALWSGDKYKWLGALPELDVEWSMDSEFVLSGLNDAITVRIGKYGEFANLTDEQIYNIQATVIKKAEDYYCNRENGRFVHPFLVRAAYKLFDGRTYVMHTSPVMMIPSFYGQEMKIASPDGTTKNTYMTCNLILGTLKYKLDSLISKDWGSVISSVDIAVSLPMDPYDYTWRDDFEYDYTHKHVEGLDYDKEEKFITVRSYTKGSEWKWNKGTQRNEFVVSDKYQPGFYEIEKTPQHQWFELKKQDDLDAYGKESTFHILKSISIEDCDTDEHTLLMPKGWYNNMSVQPVMPDDAGSHNKVAAGVSMSYNNRLNLANLEVKMPLGNDAAYSFTKNEGTSFRFWIRGQKNGEVFEECIGVSDYLPTFTETDEDTGREYQRYLLYYFYTPNPYAKELIIQYDPIPPYYHERLEATKIPLKDHPYLEGKYAFEFDGMDVPMTDRFVPNERPMVEKLGNEIRTSEANNPFVFSYKGQNVTGSGEILSLATVTTPMGYEPHGTHPLMALCTDGNYGLSVITSGVDAGLYDGVSAMQRDVCVNKDSVTMTENGILYVSNRGLMYASGNDIQCVSEALNGVSEVTGLDPRGMMDKCQIGWDYTNQRALLFQKGSSNVIALNRTNETWSVLEMADAFKEVVNTYPYSYLHVGNRLIKLDDDYNFDASKTIQGKLVTRPLKLDSLQLKKLMEFCVQGNFQSGTQTIRIYGSNDLVNWHCLGQTTRNRVGHIKGYWMKYWKLEIDTNLKESENITGVSVKYDVRQEDRIR